MRELKRKDAQVTFKTKFKIGDSVKFTNADMPEAERRRCGIELVPMGFYKISSVHLSCFANKKNITYQLEISETWNEEVGEEALKRFI